MNAKNLPKHSLPVLGMLVVAFVLSISLSNRVVTAQTRTTWATAFNTHLLSVQPTANGLARIQLNLPSASANGASPVNPAGLSDIQAVGASSGQLARLSFVVEVLNPSKLTTQK